MRRIFEAPIEMIISRRRLGRFRLKVADGVPHSWMQEVIGQLEDLPRDPRTPERRMGVVDGPVGIARCRAFVKVVSHTSPRHHKWRRRVPVQRLRPRYASHEGQALQQLAAAGIPVPRLLFYGEEWRMGIRNRGVVATELLQAPTLSDVVTAGRGTAWLEPYSRALARIHATGLSHGDAHSKNFLVQDHGLVAIDLENSRCLTHKKRLSDLASMVSSVLEHTDSKILAAMALELYRPAAGATAIFEVENLIEHGRGIVAGLA